MNRGMAEPRGAVGRADGPARAPAPLIGTMLPLSAGEVDAAGRGAWWCRRLWAMRFGWCDAHREAPGSWRLVRVHGMVPSALWGVRLERGDRVVFALETLIDRRGRPVMAGEMIDALAGIDGLCGLSFRVVADEARAQPWRLDLCSLHAQPGCSVTMHRA